MKEEPGPIQPDQEPPTKPIRLFLQLDNGKIRYLEGDDLEKWFRDINQILEFMQKAQRHKLPQDFLKVQWKETTPKEAENLINVPVERYYQDLGL